MRKMLEEAIDKTVMVMNARDPYVNVKFQGVEVDTDKLKSKIAGLREKGMYLHFTERDDIPTSSDESGPTTEEEEEKDEDELSSSSYISLSSLIDLDEDDTDG